VGLDPDVPASTVTEPLEAWTVAARLAGRESGAELLEHLRRSEAAAARLDEECTPEVIRIDTNGRTSAEVGERIRSLLPW